MRKTRLGAVLASLTVTTATAAVLAAAPAHADTPTQAGLLTSSGHQAETAPYGTYLGPLAGGVVDDVGNPVYYGDAVLQQKLPGKTWKNVRTDTTPDTFDFGRYGSSARGNVQYRVHYLGGTDGTTIWHAVWSNVVTIRTAWNLHEQGVCDSYCHMYGKLSPRAKDHRVTIQVKHGSWKTYKVVRTNRRSHWNAKVVATWGKGTLYRAVVGKTKHEIRTTSGIYRFYKVRASRSGGRVLSW
jgi:hypothetical protein